MLVLLHTRTSGKKNPKTRVEEPEGVLSAEKPFGCTHRRSCFESIQFFFVSYQNRLQLQYVFLERILDHDPIDKTSFPLVSSETTDPNRFAKERFFPFCKCNELILKALKFGSSTKYCEPQVHIICRIAFFTVIDVCDIFECIPFSRALFEQQRCDQSDLHKTTQRNSVVRTN